MPFIGDTSFVKGSMPTQETAEMFVDQVHARDTSTLGGTSNDNLRPPQSTTKKSGANLLNLPLELRLNIYGYLLPPRAHTIVTQIPYNGYFYNTSSIPENSATSFYPFGRTAPTAQKEKYTTYKVLTTNHHANFPASSIHTELLRVNKQILAEAEPVLYASKEVTWDFGVHLDALLAFWGDRSEVARRCVRNLRFASQLPIQDSTGKDQAINALWLKTCAFIKSEMGGLRNIDLTMWSSYDVTAPRLQTLTTTDTTTTWEWESRSVTSASVKMRDWECIATLLEMSALKEARLTCWEFNESQKAAEEMVQNGNFGNWIAGRMVGDRGVRERMVRDGVVGERVGVWRT